MLLSATGPIHNKKYTATNCGKGINQVERRRSALPTHTKLLSRSQSLVEQLNEGYPQRTRSSCSTTWLSGRIYESRLFGSAKMRHYLDRSQPAFTARSPLQMANTSSPAESTRLPRNRFFAPSTLQLSWRRFRKSGLGFTLIPHQTSWSFVRAERRVATRRSRAFKSTRPDYAL